MVTRVAIACVAGIALAGCSYVTDSFETNTASGDEYPIDVDTTSGAIVIGVSAAGEPPHTAVLDVLSPITLIDRGPDAQPAITYPDLTVLGARGPGGPLDLPRAEFIAPQVLALHPCQEPTCAVGTPDAPYAFDALIGMDIFASDALRLHLATDEIYILPDIAGDETRRTYACDAVFPSPFRGGGTLLVGGTELAFTNWRVAIDTCVAANPDPTLLQSQRGTNMFFVMSTAIGISIIDQDAYARYQLLDPTQPDADTLPDGSVNLPSGSVNGKLTTLPSIALVGNSTADPHAPCRQVYASHLLLQRDCMPGDDCPCTTSDDPTLTYCPVPAMVELTPAAGIPVLIVDDDNDTLQSLRTELRPDQPEVDGILGTSAIRAVELDLDYASAATTVHDRVLGRCTDPTTCSTRPELSGTATERTQVRGCLGM